MTPVPSRRRRRFPKSRKDRASSGPRHSLCSVKMQIIREFVDSDAGPIRGRHVQV